MSFTSIFRPRVLISALILALVAGSVGWLFLLRKTAPKNVILIIMDTTRADHLSPYGYERDTSPNLDAFSKDSITFDYAIASAPWTPLSIGTIITGLYPVSHGFIPPDSRDTAEKSVTRLPDALTTMAEALGSHGYQALGITPNPWTTQIFGFGQGYDKYIFRNRAPADAITKIAEVLYDERDTKRPLFLFVHYLDPHWPYEPPAPFDTKFTGDLKFRGYSREELIHLNQYDGEIAFMDQEIGKFIDFLKKRGAYDNSLIIIIGDHGEQFLEHGHLQHGNQLYNEEVHVPLMVHDGSSSPRRVDYTVSNVDVFPTVMEWAGVKDVPSQGISLFNEQQLLSRPGVLSEIYRILSERAFTSLDRKKIIWDVADDPKQSTGKLIGVFDPTTDPLEINPLHDQKLEQNLTNHFDALYRPLASAQHPEGKTVDVSPETLQQLKSLGYMK